MIKMKRYALLLAGLTLISLAGCGKQEPPLTITDNPSSVGTSADVTSAAEPNKDSCQSVCSGRIRESGRQHTRNSAAGRRNRTPGKAVRHRICRRTKTTCTDRRKNKFCFIHTAAERVGNAKTNPCADAAPCGRTATERAAAGNRTARRIHCSRF